MHSKILLKPEPEVEPQHQMDVIAGKGDLEFGGQEKFLHMPVLIEDHPGADSDPEKPVPTR